MRGLSPNIFARRGTPLLTPPMNDDIHWKAVSHPCLGYCPDSRELRDKYSNPGILEVHRSFWDDLQEYRLNKSAQIQVLILLISLSETQTYESLNQASISSVVSHLSKTLILTFGLAFSHLGHHKR